MIEPDGLPLLGSNLKSVSLAEFISFNDRLAKYCESSRVESLKDTRKNVHDSFTDRVYNIPDQLIGIYQFSGNKTNTRYRVSRMSDVIYDIILVTNDKFIPKMYYQIGELTSVNVNGTYVENFDGNGTNGIIYTVNIFVLFLCFYELCFTIEAENPILMQRSGRFLTDLRQDILSVGFPGVITE